MLTLSQGQLRMLSNKMAKKYKDFTLQELEDNQLDMIEEISRKKM